MTLPWIAIHRLGSIPNGVHRFRASVFLRRLSKWTNDISDNEWKRWYRSPHHIASHWLSPPIVCLRPLHSLPTDDHRRLWQLATKYGEPYIQKLVMFAPFVRKHSSANVNIYCTWEKGTRRTAAPLHLTYADTSYPFASKVSTWASEWCGVALTINLFPEVQ